MEFIYTPIFPEFNFRKEILYSNYSHQKQTQIAYVTEHEKEDACRMCGSYALKNDKFTCLLGLDFTQSVFHFSFIYSWWQYLMLIFLY